MGRPLNEYPRLNTAGCWKREGGGRNLVWSYRDGRRDMFFQPQDIRFTCIGTGATNSSDAEHGVLVICSGWWHWTNNTTVIQGNIEDIAPEHIQPCPSLPPPHLRVEGHQVIPDSDLRVCTCAIAVSQDEIVICQDRSPLSQAYRTSISTLTML